MIHISKIVKGGTLSLLCFLYPYLPAYGQHFFSAEILPQSKKYGEVSTKPLPKYLIEDLKNQHFTFKEWASFFYLKTAPNNLAVLGRYTIENDRIVFTPRFLPDPTIKYIVYFSYLNLVSFIAGLEEQSVHTNFISFEPPKTTQPEIVSILPEIDSVPANLLSIYLYFSSPMGLENPYDFIAIEDENGEKLEDPFVIIPEGLWNIDRTRLTLLLHPGRIKRGVGPNMTRGDVLQAGNTYTLKVNSKWKGSAGESLKSNFEQKINASNPIREAINVNNWVLQEKVDGIGTLTIITDHPLAQPLAQRMLYIRNMKGNILPASVEFEGSEKLIIHWKADGSSELELVIDPRLEDVCGNTPLHAFDAEEGTRSYPSEEIKLKFTIE